MERELHIVIMSAVPKIPPPPPQKKKKKKKKTGLLLLWEMPTCSMVRPIDTIYITLKLYE